MGTCLRVCVLCVSVWAYNNTPKIEWSQTYLNSKQNYDHHIVLGFVEGNNKSKYE